MNNELTRVTAMAQVIILALWEILAVFVFDWNALAVAAVWFVGICTFNTAIITAVRMYAKLTTPAPDTVNNIVAGDEYAKSEDLDG